MSKRARAEVVRRLREVADVIEEGGFGDVTSARVVVVCAGELVGESSMGQPLARPHWAGLYMERAMGLLTEGAVS